jgi:hypothetical protein
LPDQPHSGFYAGIDCLAGLTDFFRFIIYRLGKDSRAGKFGMFVLFIGLGMGLLSFAAKEVLKLYLQH